MYSFAQRLDTRVMDEPLFGHFLAFTGVDRPSREDVLRTMPSQPAMPWLLSPHAPAITWCS